MSHSLIAVEYSGADQMLFATQGKWCITITSCRDSLNGSEHDAKASNDLGYKVAAFDASSEMVVWETIFSKLVVQCLRFDQLTAVEEFDDIWSCASLLHVPQSELPGMIAILARALKPHGV